MQNHYTSKWRVPLWAWLPLTAAITAEAVSNSLRAYGLGMHLEKFTFTFHDTRVSVAGAVLVLAAIAVSLSQARAAWVALVPTNPWRVRIVAGLAAALLLAVSIIAMASHILEAQRAKVADEGGARSAYDRAEAAYKRATADMEALGNPRPVSVIQNEVKAFAIDGALWSRSKQCEEATKPDTQAYCRPLLALYQERGAAARKTELEPVVARLRDELASLPRPEAATAEEATIGGYWSWIMGLAVVFIATFGSVIFAKVETPDRPAQDTTGQSDFGALADHPALLKGPDGSDRPAGGTKAPVRPKPQRPTGGRRAEVSDGRTDTPKARVLAFVQTERALGRGVPRQADLVERFNVPRSTISDWLREAEADGTIPKRAMIGRCKVIAPARKRVKVA